MIALDDGTAMKGKGKQFVPAGRKIVMAFHGGAGYGPSDERDRTSVEYDLAVGYISAEIAGNEYGLSAERIEDVLAASRRGELPC